MPLVFGLLLLGTVLLLFKWYVDADIKTLKSSLRWTGILIGLIAIVLLAATGRLSAAIAFLIGLVAWAWRVFNIVFMIRGLAAGLGWKQKSDQGAGQGTGQRSQAFSMAEDEALRVLGLSPGASPEDIKAAHRRLMAQFHPDHGGSNYLAEKINAARDVLLAKHK
jgi:DnaJ-domain-containing protein 1